MDPIADELLSFWFAGLAPGAPIPATRNALWFSRSDATDAHCRERYADASERARRGELRHWEATPRGTLAEVLLLDQIPRNIHRDSPLAYASDALAVAVTLAALDRGDDAHLGVAERLFLYLPLEHAEDRALQDRSVALFEALAADAPPPLAESAAAYLRYAEAHRAVVARFGRFPHRNEVLGRATTPEEAEFLEDGRGF